MQSSGIVFDFNGTMIDDTHLHQQAWVDLVKRHWHRALTEKEINHVIHGNNNRMILGHFAGEGHPEDSYARLSEEKEALYRQLCAEEGLALLPGLPALLDALKEKGIPLNIASSSIASNIAFYFSHFGLSRWFERERVAFDDGVTPPKPNPDMYLAAMDRVGIDPARCLVFEDSAVGARAAIAAGVRGIYLRTKAAPADVSPHVLKLFLSYDQLNEEKLFRLLGV